MFLIKYGIDDRHIYKEQISSRIKNRPELSKALSFLKKGDTFVVCKLDRLGRSVSHLIELMRRFDKDANLTNTILEDING